MGVRDSFIGYQTPVWDNLQNNFTQRVNGCVRRHEECESSELLYNKWSPCVNEKLGHFRMYRSFKTHALQSNQLREAKKALALHRGPPW